MKKIILLIIVALMTLTILVMPVLAIGPVNAYEVGNNPNITLGDLVKERVWMDASNNSMSWNFPQDFIFLDVDSTTGQGRMNNAIIVDWTILQQVRTNRLAYVNQWLFFCGDNNGPTYTSAIYGTHGMLYWFSLYSYGPSYVPIVMARHPNGVFAIIHHVGPVE